MLSDRNLGGYCVWMPLVLKPLEITILLNDKIRIHIHIYIVGSDSFPRAAAVQQVISCVL
jgi:hypothetical protein